MTPVSAAQQRPKALIVIMQPHGSGSFRFSYGFRQALPTLPKHENIYNLLSKTLFSIKMKGSIAFSGFVAIAAAAPRGFRGENVPGAQAEGKMFPTGSYSGAPPFAGTGFPAPSGHLPMPSGGFPMPPFPMPSGGFPIPSGGFPMPSGGFPMPSGFPPMPSDGYPSPSGAAMPSGAAAPSGIEPYGAAPDADPTAMAKRAPQMTGDFGAGSAGPGVAQPTGFGGSEGGFGSSGAAMPTGFGGGQGGFGASGSAQPTASAGLFDPGNGFGGESGFARPSGSAGGFGFGGGAGGFGGQSGFAQPTGSAGSFPTPDCGSDESGSAQPTGFGGELPGSAGAAMPTGFPTAARV
ncbi:hypothetical protein KC349_g1414 [Hortaea werneckii]|nr:hypothetical protein KC349_g1414 [Hortaea werneckii]